MQANELSRSTLRHHDKLVRDRFGSFDSSMLLSASSAPGRKISKTASDVHIYS